MRKEHNDWGRDPAVRQMRKVFAEMEHVQKALLDQLKLSPFDDRLGLIRETARNLFEKAAARGTANGIHLSDNTMIGIYSICLHQALKSAGLALKTDLLPDDRILRDLVREVSQ